MQKNLLLILVILSTIAPQIFSQATLPPRIFGDSLHAPFYHGVASGDPLDTAIIIWTRITPAIGDYTTRNVNYELATDSLFLAVVTSGVLSTDSSQDWTIKKDVTGLMPNTIYYYRFDDGLGNYSEKGRTRTAPNSSVSDLKFAIFSCSSIYSGYFNAYARVAEKADSLNAAIHLGDYIYDFVDAEEEVRVPNPYPIEPNNLEEWRDRQEYYLLDPDLRTAKAKLPWICLWDNHDQDCGGSYACTFGGGNKAFLEWLPIRVPDTTNQLNIYRTISYGSLADIFVTDALMFRHGDTLANGEYNMLGDTQFSWLTQRLQSSTAKWKLIPQQRMMGGWYTTGISPWILDIIPNSGPVFDDGSWDGFPESKAQLFNFLRTQFIDNIIVLSGDAHVSIAQDMVEDPHNATLYDPATGLGSVAVEFLPTSVTRGNMDESGAPIGMFTTINLVDRLANPQHQFADLFNHGYGILHLKADSSIAQFWYTPKLEISSQDSLGATLVVKDGDNHWSRTSGFSSINNQEENSFKLFPSPARESITVQFDNPVENQLFVEIIDICGKLHRSTNFESTNTGNLFFLNIESLSSGIYFIKINNAPPKKFIKI